MTEIIETKEIGMPRWVRWSGAAGAVALALTLQPGLSPWLFMWTMTGGIFAGFKLLAAQGRAHPGWLFLWPGMDPRPFARQQEPLPVARWEWACAGAKTLAGAALVWIITRRVEPPLVAGWVGMIGTILMLHFGSFHLLALAWRRAGYNVRPLMDRPLAARTLADFWGARWNRAFSEVARRELLRPLLPRIGPAGATMAVFLFSGVIHELAITVPAGGGYGLPTAYFLFQGLASLWQRASAEKRRAYESHESKRIERGALSAFVFIRVIRRQRAGEWRARIFTLLVVAVPAFWLFPPVFVERVFLPFLEAMHAL